MRDLLFTLAMTAISRILIARDRLFHRIPKTIPEQAATSLRSRHALRSGTNLLDAVFVRPAQSQPQAALLLCHGIGETVDYWLPVQQLLATANVASLVFDYSGYGRSSGFFNAHQSEHDAIAAFHLLEGLAPALPLYLLGFSLGSGVAAAIAPKVSAKNLFLCAAFTSFHQAAISIGFPRFLSFLITPLWRAEDSLKYCSVPIVIIHGERDELFHVQTARDLAALCGSLCGSPRELLVIPKLSHNQPFYTPQPAYWNLIVSRMIPETSIAARTFEDHSKKDSSLSRAAKRHPQ